jgi:hypothetical protein
MSANEFVLSILSLGSSILAGWGYTIMVTPGGSTRAARILFWITAMGFGSLGAVWAANQEHLTPVNLSIAAIIGATAAVGLAWVLSQLEHPVMAQDKEAPVKSETTQSNQSGPNISISGSGNRLVINPTPQQPRGEEVIYQAGIVVGRVFGGRRSPTDATLFEFQEITQAGQFNTNAEFEYQGFILRPLSMIMSTRNVDKAARW